VLRDDRIIREQAPPGRKRNNLKNIKPVTLASIDESEVISDTATPSEKEAAAEEDGELPTRTPDGRRIVYDWKGDPMIINPGDNLPGM